MYRCQKREFKGVLYNDQYPILNKCINTYCDCDDECQTGYCFQQLDVQTNQIIGQCKERPISCNNNTAKRCTRTSKRIQEYPDNLCNGLSCLWDGDCQSGYCSNKMICQSYESREVISCNKSEKYPISRNNQSGLISYTSATNRCINIQCTMDMECTSKHCKEGLCSQCDRLCLNSNCTHDSQCESNICFNSTCQSLTNCNSSISFIVESWSVQQQIASSNRCINVTCTNNADCQQFAICTNKTCSLRQNQSEKEAESMEKFIIMILVPLSVFILIVLLCTWKFVYAKNKPKVKIHINSGMVVQGVPMTDVSVIESSMDQTIVIQERQCGRHPTIIDTSQTN
ncbi:hypothetical protein FGO68_gene3269 [Halteria grandinella]|uniref:Uncharacterized protein n=1 Tax=Halteria grandinella TaxID=5974 RepID=A0A8J8P0I9_HALGN|nr:hypothetical protein FGO68_gene3269 [Halteria grandinella]